MSAINNISVRLATGNRSGAGTNGDIYIGICGREFYIDSQGLYDDFERGEAKTYTLGNGPSVNFPDYNDPRGPYPLDDRSLDAFPVYLRFEPTGPDDNWNLESVQVTVNPGQSQVVYRALWGANNNLWLGTHAGKTCYLKKV